MFTADKCINDVHRLWLCLLILSKISERSLLQNSKDNWKIQKKIYTKTDEAKVALFHFKSRLTKNNLIFLFYITASTCKQTVSTSVTSLIVLGGKNVYLCMIAYCSIHHITVLLHIWRLRTTMHRLKL